MTDAVDMIRVLLADDHQILRQGLAELLRAQPDIHLVGEAEDGERACAMARQLHPDIVIMDVTMPNMDGIEATRRIVADTPQTRVIGLSMHETADLSEAMTAAGASAYFTKGSPLETLMAAIRALAAPQSQ